MRILMITPEASPFAQTGGLGEVIQALPAELVALGLHVDVLMPKYRSIDTKKFPIQKTGLQVEVTLNAKPVKAEFRRLKDPRGVQYLFVDAPEYFDRDYLYGSPEADYEDNSERFVFLARAGIEYALATKTHYDIFHAHDWQASLTPVYMRTLYAGEPLLDGSASVMTIHNLGYQGIFWHLDMPLVGVGWEFFTPKHMEFHGKLNFLKSGIVFADEVNTVSPGYRDEILTSAFGFGMEGVLLEKGDHLTGILNGVNYEIWNPALDDFIKAKYGIDDLSGKKKCKAELQRIAGVKVDPKAPILGMVTRLSNQKGVDLVGAIVPSLVQRGIQIILLGTGDGRLEDMFREFRERYPERVGIFLSYDYPLAHKMFAGSDMLLVPSRYEPCGLTQLYALKYGTVPIVRMTGGLIDTVEEFNLVKNSGTGFRLAEAEPIALERAIYKALEIYHSHPNAWRELMIRGMQKDFSWRRSAEGYKKLYQKALDDRKALSTPL